MEWCQFENKFQTRVRCCLVMCQGREVRGKVSFLPREKELHGRMLVQVSDREKELV